MDWTETFFLLLCGHALADFVLQPAIMGYGKNRNRQTPVADAANLPPWYYWLSAHALIHGGLVNLITGSFILGILESATHWLIDFAKCEKWISMRTDQAFHVLLKLAYALYYHASLLPKLP